MEKTHVRILLDLFNSLGVKLARVSVEVISSGIVGVQNTLQITLTKATTMNIGDPAEVALQLRRAGARLESNDVASLDDLAAAALDRGGSGGDSTKEGRSGDAEGLEVDHLELLRKGK